MNNNSNHLPIKKIILLIYILSTANTYLIAQDTHYNTIQIGARSVLMGGAVIGNVKDNTAVYYNPAALAFIDTSNISLNGNAYQIDNIRIYNAVGNNKDFVSDQLGSNPLFVGGMFSKTNKHLKVGYSIMNNVEFNFKATARIDSFLPVVNTDESPGNEEFIGQESINTRLNETVFAIGGGFKLSKEWSVGLTNMIIVRSNYCTKTSYARFFLNNASQDMVSSSFSRTADYYNVRYVARLGINFRKDRFSAGATINLPSLNIFGSGSIAADIIGSNLMYDGKRTALLANDRQEKLHTTYKSPLEIAGGINYIAKKSAIGVAVQYFTGISAYNVMRGEYGAFYRPASLYPDLGSDQFLKVTTAAKPVFNFAIGYEYALKPQLIISGSYRTNQSFYDADLQKTVAMKTEVTTWNIHHFTLGSNFLAGRSRLTLGILYSYGKDDNRQQEGNFSSPDESNYLQGKTIITKATYHSIGVLIGYTFGLQSKI